ncbi:hypothetical protein IAQ61_006391 [Plenodomus lingam]|uniref:uncharacterized protein n=1 Tax=Leptosphaeria maculans TaxID=5022 RepID=UPI00332DB53D|nr:hypothetical protein IAQ61_006391 [Plenodomus lingam]
MDLTLYLTSKFPSVGLLLVRCGALEGSSIPEALDRSKISGIRFLSPITWLRSLIQCAHR